MFETFLGNKDAKSLIGSMLKENHLPHALLISGPDGVGKKTFVKEICLSLLCLSEIERPCNSCNPCRTFLSGSNPDFSEISATKGLIGVDIIRQLKKDAYIRPSKSEKRVFLINHADCMNESAQNAFLKLLEEPPNYAVFILIAENSAKLLDTVLSRCTEIKLLPPSFEEAKDFLLSKKLYSEKDIDLSLFRSENNIKKALSLLDGGTFSGSFSDARTLLILLSEGKTLEMLKILKAYENRREETAALLVALNDILSLELRLKSNGETGITSASKSDIIRIKNAVAEISDAHEKHCSSSLLLTSLCAEMKI